MLMVRDIGIELRFEPALFYLSTKILAIEVIENKASASRGRVKLARQYPENRFVLDELFLYYPDPPVP